MKKGHQDGQEEERNYKMPPDWTYRVKIINERSGDKESVEYLDSIKSTDKELMIEPDNEMISARSKASIHSKNSALSLSPNKLPKPNDNNAETNASFFAMASSRNP